MIARMDNFNGNDGTRDESRSAEAIAVIGQVSRVAMAADYIYRGEPECYRKVSSSLYRHYEDIESTGFDIETVQKEIVDAARRFTTETHDDEVLAQLQHFGWYGTNFIDFTTDVNVALFFACDGHHDEDGRIVFLKKTNPNFSLPKTPSNRVIAQKSVFVRPPEGFVEPDHIVLIPKHVKQPLLAYLSRCHGISPETIYNDLHGFNHYYHQHQSAYAQFHLGITKGNQHDPDGAIEHFTECVRLNPNEIRAYRNRAMLYMDIEKYDLAFADYAKAIELNNQGSDDYFLRGFANAHLKHHDQAIEDFDVAIAMDPAYAPAYVERGRSMGEIGETYAAIRDFDKALELDPDNPLVFEFRGQQYQHIDNHARAVEDFSKAIGLDADKPYPHFGRGLSNVHIGEYDTALIDFNNVIKLKPDIGHGYCGRGVLQLLAKQWDEAQCDFTSALDREFDVASFFEVTFRSITKFEATHQINLPSEVAELLDRET